MKKNIFILILLLTFCCTQQQKINIYELEKERVLKNANENINIQPITITANIAKRSAGNQHDFYSEGDYWWPNPEDLDGAYIRKDGVTNPDNFTKHREAMIRFCEIAGSLGSAYIITNDEKYVEALLPHLKAWFINEDTKMNPNLLFAQAIKGKVTGRGIGIIDTIHLLEVALAVKAIEGSKTVNKTEIIAIKKWFSEYLNWLTTHPFGDKERDNGNNHSTCWTLQVAVFADLVDNKKQIEFCKTFYKETLLPEQMAVDGSFPKETARTKPYGYSLFNLDAMTSLCQILSTENDNLFDYETKDGKSIQLGMKFLYPFIKIKEDWPFQKDVMYWENWPVKHASLLFTASEFKNKNYLELWKSLKYDEETSEIIRNTIVKNPVLWVE